MGRCQKLDIILEKKSDLRIDVIKKNVNNKKYAPKLIFLNEKTNKQINKKDSDNF